MYFRTVNKFMYYNQRLKRRFMSFRVDDAFARRLSPEVQSRPDPRSEFVRKAIKGALTEKMRKEGQKSF